MQCGSPDDLYRRPVDLFVATFVGTPPMNVLHARLSGTDELVADIGQHHISLGDARRWPHVARLAGREVALGIRPSAFTIAIGADITTVPVEITRVEHLGGERLVTATLEARGVTVAGDGVEVRDGPVMSVTALVDAAIEVNLWRPVHLRVDLDELHLFDLSTGLRIASSERVDVARPQRGTRSDTARGSTS